MGKHVCKPVQNRFLSSAFVFSVLLNLKHLYVTVAPAFFIIILRKYCFTDDPVGRVGFMLDRIHRRLMGTSLGRFSWRSFLSVAMVVLFVFVLSFGPFIAMGQLPQV